MKLKECPDCTHKISVTAMSCPVCGWVIPIPLEENSLSNSNTAQKAGKAGAWIAGTAVIVALGPVAVTGALASLLVPSGIKRKRSQKESQRNRRN